MRHGRARFALAGLLVAATAGAAGPAAAAPPAGTPAAIPATGATVTLLTGDVVTLGGPHGADVVAAKGREHIGFRTHTDVDGDINVIPDDALAGVASGKLDPRLFDISELARSGYGDRKDLPLIVDFPGAEDGRCGAGTAVGERGRDACGEDPDGLGDHARLGDEDLAGRPGQGPTHPVPSGARPFATLQTRRIRFPPH